MESTQYRRLLDKSENMEVEERENKTKEKRKKKKAQEGDEWRERGHSKRKGLG